MEHKEVRGFTKDLKHQTVLRAFVYNKTKIQWFSQGWANQLCHEECNGGNCNCRLF